MSAIRRSSRPGGWKGYAANAALLAFGIAVALILAEIALRLTAQAVIYLRRPVVAADASSIRILCLGESTTADPAFSAEHSYPAQLERILNARGDGRSFTVVNAGVPGTSTDRILAGLDENLERHRPHIVVTMMGINDGVPIDPLFQVSDSLRVVKLARLLYSRLRGVGDSTFDEPRKAKRVPSRRRHRKEDLESAFQTAKLIADGRFSEAEARLLTLIDNSPDRFSPVRLVGFGQMAVLNYQRGDLAAAERYRQLFSEIMDGHHKRSTTHNYRALKRRLDEQNIGLVAVQYPSRPLATLRQVLGDPSDVVFVDNEATFLEATRTMPLRELYRDLFAASFGHLTPAGNFMLAENVADGVATLLGDSPVADGAGALLADRTNAPIPGRAAPVDAQGGIPLRALLPDPGGPVPVNGEIPVHVDFDVADDLSRNFKVLTREDAPGVVHDASVGGRLKVPAGTRAFLVYDTTPDHEATNGYQDFTTSFTWQSASPPTLAFVFGADSHRHDGDLITSDAGTGSALHTFEITVRRVDPTAVQVHAVTYREAERIDARSYIYGFRARTSGEVIIGATATHADVFLDDFHIGAAKPIPKPEVERAELERGAAARP